MWWWTEDILDLSLSAENMKEQENISGFLDMCFKKKQSTD